MAQKQAGNTEGKIPMSTKSKNEFLRIVRSVHGWVGILILPWVIIMGLTGIYMNHSKAVLSLFPSQKYSESQFDDFHPLVPITETTALELASAVWPDQPVKKIWQKNYSGRPSYLVRKKGGLIVLSIPTGHHYIKTRYYRWTFSPDGQLLHHKLYWGRVFKDLHQTGWLGGALGTFWADMVSIALIVFGLTGGTMWLMPRFRRWRRLN